MKKILNERIEVMIMKHFKLFSAVCASVMAAAAVSANVFAADNEAEKIKTVCEHFVKTDVNGKALVSVPENTSAKVLITYESPEDDAHKYYDSNLKGGKIYSFDIEGYDTYSDDYRKYTISVTLTGGKYNITSSAYTDTFTIPDGNDNPNSFRELDYNFSIDDAEGENDWDVVKSSGDSKDIVVHLNRALLGDVDGNNTVDAFDASCVLVEYAALSTGKDTTLNLKQKYSADVNKDGTIDSSDASKILAYYAASSTGRKPSWD